MAKLLLRCCSRSTSLSHDHLSSQRFSLVIHRARVFSTDANGETKAETAVGGGAGGYDDEKYPKGEFVLKQRSAWEKFLLNTRLFFALPWARFEKGSVLKMTLRGEISDQLKSFSRALSLPQICENFEKAAYDPRVVD